MQFGWARVCVMMRHFRIAMPVVRLRFRIARCHLRVAALCCVGRRCAWVVCVGCQLLVVQFINLLEVFDFAIASRFGFGSSAEKALQGAIECVLRTQPQEPLLQMQNMFGIICRVFRVDSTQFGRVWSPEPAIPIANPGPRFGVTFTIFGCYF